MIQIRTYHSALKEDWNQFVDRSTNATFLFNRNFMDYHQDRFDDFSLLCYKNEKLVALFPANKKENTVFSHQGLSYGGLLVLENCNSFDYLAYFEALLIFLKNEKFLKLELKTIPKLYVSVFSEVETLALQLVKAKRTRVDAYFAMDVVNGYKPNRNRKRALKVAASRGLTFVEDGDLAYFWEHILTKNLNQKFGVNPVHTFEEIQLLKSRFPKEIQFFAAYNGSVLKAGVVMFVTKNVAHFQYSSGDDDRSEDAALDFLFDAIIKKYTFKQKISFGNSSENQGATINAGLAYWKESFGGKLHTQEYYTIKTKNHIRLADVFSITI